MGFSGNNTGVGRHFLLQRIFLIQGSNPSLLHCRQTLYRLSYKGSLSESEVAQSRVTLCDPMDCSLPGSSICGIFQARIVEWVAISFSRRSSWPRDWTWFSCIASRLFTVWATTVFEGLSLMIFLSFNSLKLVSSCSENFLIQSN